MSYTCGQAVSKVHHFKCRYAKGEHKGYEILISRGAGHVIITVSAQTEDLQNEIRNEVIDNEYPIFELVGESEGDE